MHALTILNFREGCAYGAHAHNDHGLDDHSHDETDPHVWLDPVNAKALVYEIKDALTKANPAMADNFRIRMHDAH